MAKPVSAARQKLINAWKAISDESGTIAYETLFTLYSEGLDVEARVEQIFRWRYERAVLLAKPAIAGAVSIPLAALIAMSRSDPPGSASAIVVTVLTMLVITILIVLSAALIKRLGSVAKGYEETLVKLAGIRGRDDNSGVENESTA
jgi:hypothetical protein